MNATTRNGTQATDPVTPTKPTTPDGPIEPAQDAGTEEIEQHIAQTRDQLGDTVTALAHKLDVTSQAQEKVAAVRGKAGDLAEHTKSTARSPRNKKIAAAAATAAAGGAAIAGTVAWMRRR